MMDIKKILLISTNNTSRGVIAEAILNRMLLEKGRMDIEVKSRGLVVLFPEPVNAKAALVLEKNGISYANVQAMQVTQEDFEDCDLVLTMTEEQKEKVLEDFEVLSLVYTLKEFAGEQGEMLNPYGKDVIDYEYCFREMERLIEKAIKNIIGGTEE
ncbi:MAG: hypothetical protein ACI4CT_09205 [Lachnospiraceae bacterium]